MKRISCCILLCKLQSPLACARRTLALFTLKRLLCGLLPSRPLCSPLRSCLGFSFPPLFPTPLRSTHNSIRYLAMKTLSRFGETRGTPPRAYHAATSQLPAMAVFLQRCDHYQNYPSQ